MRSLRPLTLAIALALLSLASAQGAAASGTVACSTDLRAGGCYVERTVFSAGPIVIALGVDGYLDWARDATDSYLSPYVGVTYASGAWLVWVEVALPEGRVPVFGKPDPVRLGFSFGF